MDSHNNQSIGMVTSDGVATAAASSSSITNTPIVSSTVNFQQKNFMDHIYGMGTSQAASSSNSNGIMQAVAPPTFISMRGRSRVWNEFSVTADGKKVSCHRCGDLLAYSNSHSTSSMLKHLKRKHNLDLYPVNIPGEENDSSGTSSSSTTTQQQSNESRNRSGNAEKRARNGGFNNSNNTKSMKRHISNDGEEMDTTIQHGPLLFKDPCVRMKWTDHSDTFVRTFSTLYSDESYTDVTVVVEKQFFKAHRVILSSASEFFDESFKMTPVGQHPIIFLKDMKAVEFRILLDFIYKGEVSIPPSVIPSLVKIGSELRVRGLSDFVWNEQLATNILQAKSMQQEHQEQQQQQIPLLPQPVISENRRFVQQVQPNLQSNLEAIETCGTVSHRTPMNIANPYRTTLLRQPLQSQQTIQLEGHQAKRMFSTIVNMRPPSKGNTGVSNALSSSPNGLQQQDQSQIISGDLSTVCSSVANTFPNMKHIRIVTSQPRLSPQTTSATNGISKMNLNTTSVVGGISLAETGAVVGRQDTVLMVTNEGETLLSTTQGGVTLLTQPNSAMTIPLGPQQVIQTVQQHTVPLSSMEQLRPVITSITSQAHVQQQQEQQSGENGGVVSNQELDEVVYSIAEISEASGGRVGNDEEVRLLPDHDMVCQEPREETSDKKPFLQDNQTNATQF